MPESSTSNLMWSPNIPSFSSTAKVGEHSVPKMDMRDSLYMPQGELIDGLFVPPNDPKKLNKLTRKNKKDTAGEKWFDMPMPTVTPELKKDLEILRLRSVIDPKRHFKKGGISKTLPKYFQVGTVIEPPSEYFSSRLAKKERKPTLVDEILSDPTLKKYRKRKVTEIEEVRRPGGLSKWSKRGKKGGKHGKNRRKVN